MRVSSFGTMRLVRFISSCPAGESPPPTRLLRVGDVLTERRRFSLSDVAQFSEVSGDRNPLHLEDGSAKTAGFRGGRVVHGMLVASLFPSAIAARFPGAVYASQSLKFTAPVYIGSEVRAEVEATQLRKSMGKFIVKFMTKCFIVGEECAAIEGEATAILPTLSMNED